MKKSFITKIICVALALLTISATAVYTVSAAYLGTVTAFNPSYDKETNTVTCKGTYSGILQPTRVYMISLVDANNRAISTKNPTGSELDKGNGTFSYSFSLDSSALTGYTMPMKMTLKCVTAGVLDEVTAEVSDKAMVTISFTAGDHGVITGIISFEVEKGTYVSALNTSDYPTVTADPGYRFHEWECEAENGRFTSDTVFTAKYERVLGDVNCDGFVDNADAAAILRYDASITSTIDFAAADVNGDGYVDNVDAVRILKYDAGIIDRI